jgi:integrase
MPKLKYRSPSYRLHKPSGQAVVTINGKDHYLGPHGSDESVVEYKRLIAEWTAVQAAPSPSQASPAAADGDLRVSELLVAYLKFAGSYYVKHGQPTGELDNIKYAVDPLRDLYARQRVADFGPRCLKAVRDRMIESGLCRSVINGRVNRIRRAFKWGVENELVPPSVLPALQAVAPLKAGRSKARETAAVEPVPVEHIEAVLPLVTHPVRAMIELQLVTGMRPGEVVLMRPCDIERSEKIWAYRPASHKTEHHGLQRIIYLGPRAQRIVQPFLDRAPTAYLFSPKDAVLAAREKLKPRKGKRRRTMRVRGYRRCPSDRYARTAYQNAICKACVKAKIPSWGPNRLRHNAATVLRSEFGIEAARVILGHTSSSVTEIYAALDQSKAAEIMGQVG